MNNITRSVKTRRSSASRCASRKAIVDDNASTIRDLYQVVVENDLMPENLIVVERSDLAGVT